MDRRPYMRLALRTITCLMLIFFAFAWYAEWSYELSPESLRYQNDYPDTVRSGLSFAYLLSKLTWIVGVAAGLSGSLLALLSKRIGLIPLAASAPLLALGAQLQAPPANYPSVEPMYMLLLWCSAAACWASALTLGCVALHGGNSSPRRSD